MNQPEMSCSLSPADDRRLRAYPLFWSALLLLAAPLGALYSGEGTAIWQDFRLLLLSPSKLVTDYFNLGGLGAAFLNAGLCGLACAGGIYQTKAPMSSTLLAGFFLVIAHCFYGLNLLNMWPPFLGIILYSRVKKQPLGAQLHLAMFATSLGPFISDFLFRYAQPREFVLGESYFSLAGALLSLVFGILAGFLIPALIPGTASMVRGYNLFKAGLAIGLFGVFAYALFYKTLGKTGPEVIVRDNPLYESFGNSYGLFVNLFFLTVFLLTFLWGFFANGRSFQGYRKLWRCDGWQDDFPVKCGVPVTFLNIGLYGLCVLLYMNLVVWLTEGAGFTGPTTGVIIAAITFSAGGQNPRNVWPIALGYIFLYHGTLFIEEITGISPGWTVSTQSYINGMAFATGLCPFAGRYGVLVGILAGMLHAILCSSTSAMHGGFVLYNGGFTAGLTAMLLLPILDFYKLKPRENTDGE